MEWPSKNKLNFKVTELLKVIMHCHYKDLFVISFSSSSQGLETDILQGGTI